MIHVNFKGFFLFCHGKCINMIAVSDELNLKKNQFNDIHVKTAG